MKAYSMVKTHEADDGEMVDALFALCADGVESNICMQELGNGDFRVYRDLGETQQDVGFATGYAAALAMGTKAYILNAMKTDEAF